MTAAVHLRPPCYCKGVPHRYLKLEPSGPLSQEAGPFWHCVGCGRLTADQPKTWVGAVSPQSAETRRHQS